MVLSEFVGSAALGASGVWSYNRENFMYDREMRQRQEFQVIAMKLKQVDLWREDVRDLTDLTETKMDRYMVVNAVQLGFCVTLFTEGRLPPGTPEWLLWLYTMSLASAFLFLLMSLWFAMHASVVAQSNSVRLLTQLVRLPIPSWHHLEATRTYGAAFEGLPPVRMMRVPFLQTLSEGLAENHGWGTYAPNQSPADPWGMERPGEDIYELQRRPLAAQRHVLLVREALRQWQAYDAFARVSMTLGSIMFCTAMSYYVLGYVLVQDGSPWAAWMGVITFQSIASKLLRLDVSMSCCERGLANVLLVGGVAISSVAAADWATYKDTIQWVASASLPIAFAVHGAFLLLFLRLCHVLGHSDGTFYPSRFRSVLYLDVFGWLALHQRELAVPNPPPSNPHSPSKSVQVSKPRGTSLDAEDGDPDMRVSLPASQSRDHRKGLTKTTSQEHGSTPQEPGLLEGGKASLPEPVGAPLSFDPGAGAGRNLNESPESPSRRTARHQSFPRRFHSPARHTMRPDDVERTSPAISALHCGRGSGALDPSVGLLGVGPSGVVPKADRAAFAPAGFGPEVHTIEARSRRDLQVEEGGMPAPGQMPWLVFRAAVWLVTSLWFVGSGWCLCQLAELPDLHTKMLPASVSISGETVPEPERRVSPPHTKQRHLRGGSPIRIDWPTEHFQPTGISCDMAEQLCAFSDGFQLYSAFLNPSLSVNGTRLAPPCLPLEGQALEDVAVACHAQAHSADVACSAFVLHNRGGALAECSLPRPHGHDRSDTGAPAKAKTPASVVAHGGGTRSWSLARGWLRPGPKGGPPERITSVAVDEAREGLFAGLVPGPASLVVGTSYGRAVRLRQSSQDGKSELIPAGNVWRQNVGQNSPTDLQAHSPLQILAGGYLFILDGRSSRVHVINTTNEQNLAELELPKTSKCSWIALTGGRSHLFALSSSLEDGSVGLWQFPLLRVLADLA